MSLTGKGRRHFSFYTCALGTQLGVAPVRVVRDVTPAPPRAVSPGPGTHEGPSPLKVYS